MPGTYFNENPAYTATVTSFSPLTASVAATPSTHTFQLDLCSATAEGAVDVVTVLADDGTNQTQANATGTLPAQTVDLAWTTQGTYGVTVQVTFTDGGKPVVIELDDPIEVGA